MDQVQDSGLNCKLLITRYPLGGAITERAIPVAIFESEPAIMRHYIKKWAKSSNMSEEAGDFDIRNLIDWEYYVTRLNTCIQKIITIPAALQRIANPVPRCVHPDWLRKVVREKLDPFKQKSMTNFFTQLKEGEKNVLKDVPHEGDDASVAAMEIEEFLGGEEEREQQAGGGGGGGGGGGRGAGGGAVSREDTTFEGWLSSRKKQWKLRRLRRKRLRGGNQDKGSNEHLDAGERQQALRGGMGSYMRANADALAMADYHWQVVEIRPISPPGTFRMFCMTGPSVMEKFDVIVPRTLYTNSRVPMEIMRDSDSFQTRRVSRILPRSHRPMNLYEINLSESRFKRNEKTLSNFLTHPDLEGVYELGVSLLLKAVMELGCVVKPTKAVIKERRRHKVPTTEPYRLDQLEMLTTAKYEYLEPRNSGYTYRRAYVFHSSVDRRSTVGLFVVHPIKRNIDTGAVEGIPTATVHMWLSDPKGTGARPNLRRIWREYTGGRDSDLHFPQCDFVLGTVRTENAALAAAGSKLGEILRSTKNKSVPTIVHVESPIKERSELLSRMPVLHEVPIVEMRNNTSDSHYPALGWQNFAVQRALQRFVLANGWWEDRVE